MVSAKGNPTDPKLKEKVTQEVKNQPNKDGSGKGMMAAWKAAKIGKEYESRGGDYTNSPGSKDKPQKGPPVKKSASEKNSETKTAKVSSIRNHHHKLQQASSPNAYRNTTSHSDSNTALPPPLPTPKRAIKIVLRLKKKEKDVPSLAIGKGDGDGDRGSGPGSKYELYLPRIQTPLRNVRNRSDSSMQQEARSGSGSESEEKEEKEKKKTPVRGGAKKVGKEPKKGVRSSARQAEKKDVDANANGDADLEKANRGKKRKSGIDDDDAGSTSSKKSKREN